MPHTIAASEIFSCLFSTSESLAQRAKHLLAAWLPHTVYTLDCCDVSLAQKAIVGWVWFKRPHD